MEGWLAANQALPGSVCVAGAKTWAQHVLPARGEGERVARAAFQSCTCILAPALPAGASC